MMQSFDSPPNGPGFSRAVRDAMMAQLGRQGRSGPRRLQPLVGRRFYTPIALFKLARSSRYASTACAQCSFDTTAATVEIVFES
jgi:hypothetical protein